MRTIARNTDLCSTFASKNTNMDLRGAELVRTLRANPMLYFFSEHNLHIQKYSSKLSTESNVVPRTFKNIQETKRNKHAQHAKNGGGESTHISAKLTQ
jgi:hypothetical protein